MASARSNVIPFPGRHRNEIHARLRERCIKFLAGIAESQRIEAQLAEFGFAEDDFDEGICLVFALDRAAPADAQARIDVLRGWLGRWSRVARAAITRRSDLVRLGLADPDRPDEQDPPSFPPVRLRAA